MSFGTNVVSFTITTGWKKWRVVGAYVPVNNQPGVHWVVQALSREPEGVGTLLVDDLNTCLSQPRDQREEDLETAIDNHGLTDQLMHFTPRRRYRGERGRQWRTWIDGRPILGQGE